MMKQNLLHAGAIALFHIFFSFNLNAQIAAPVLDSVSKGTFPTHIWMRWSYDFKKYPPNEVNFVVQRKTLVNSTKGKFSKITIVSPKNYHITTLQDRSSDLRVRTQYVYQVKAIWKGQESAWSNEMDGFLKATVKMATIVPKTDTLRSGR